MNLPAKRPEPDDVPEAPTWRELRERATDLLNTIVREGKELERELEPRILPALRGLKAQIEKLIAKIEGRTSPPPPPSPGE